MKKSLIALTLAAGMSLGGIVYAQGVGDKMPKYKKGTLPSSFRQVVGMDNGLIFFYRDAKTNEPRYTVARVICGEDKKGKIFGIYDVEKDTLYLDNKPLDGLIDEIRQDPTNNPIYLDAPKCK